MASSLTRTPIYCDNICHNRNYFMYEDPGGAQARAEDDETLHAGYWDRLFAGRALAKQTGEKTRGEVVASGEAIEWLLSWSSCRRFFSALRSVTVQTVSLCNGTNGFSLLLSCILLIHFRMRTRA